MAMADCPIMSALNKKKARSVIVCRLIDPFNVDLTPINFSVGQFQNGDVSL
jgi:hypothetical protein